VGGGGGREEKWPKHMNNKKLKLKKKFALCYHIFLQLLVNISTISIIFFLNIKQEGFLFVFSLILVSYGETLFVWFLFLR
jgi:hypothetical protein